MSVLIIMRSLPAWPTSQSLSTVSTHHNEVTPCLAYFTITEYHVALTNSDRRTDGQKDRTDSITSTADAGGNTFDKLVL